MSCFRASELFLDFYLSGKVLETLGLALIGEKVVIEKDTACRFNRLKVFHSSQIAFMLFTWLKFKGSVLDKVPWFLSGFEAYGALWTLLVLQVAIKIEWGLCVCGFFSFLFSEIVLSKRLLCGVYVEEFITCGGCREGSPRSFLVLTYSHSCWSVCSGIN